MQGTVRNLCLLPASREFYERGFQNERSAARPAVTPERTRLVARVFTTTCVLLAAEARVPFEPQSPTVRILQRMLRQMRERG